MEETGGAWSTGEFGTVLVDLFSPATDAAFNFRRDSRAGGIMAKMYDFEVTRENSHWSIHAGAQKLQSGVLRLGMDRSRHRARAAHRDGGQGLARAIFRWTTWNRPRITSTSAWAMPSSTCCRSMPKL